MSQPVDPAAQRLVQEHLAHLHEVVDTHTPEEKRALRERIVSFVPAHPIAGKEVSGIDHAVAALYAGRQVILPSGYRDRGPIREEVAAPRPDPSRGLAQRAPRPRS